MADLDLEPEWLSEELAGMIHDHLVAHAEKLTEQAREIRHLTGWRYLQRVGLYLHDAPDALAGRLAKAGWESVVYDTNKPGWRIHGRGYERYVSEAEVGQVLAPVSENGGPSDV